MSLDNCKSFASLCILLKYTIKFCDSKCLMPIYIHQICFFNSKPEQESSSFWQLQELKLRAKQTGHSMNTCFSCLWRAGHLFTIKPRQVNVYFVLISTKRVVVLSEAQSASAYPNSLKSSVFLKVIPRFIVPFKYLRIRLTRAQLDP